MNKILDNTGLEEGQDLRTIMQAIGTQARTAAAILATATTQQKNSALFAIADSIDACHQEILNANKVDVDNGHRSGLSQAFIDRLQLDDARLETMAGGIREIAGLPEPVGRTLASWERPNGLHIERVSTPIGVIGVIYESRPNVTVDAGALCLKSGNAVILRGGSDSFHSSKAIHASIIKGLAASDLPVDVIQMVPTTDRMAVGEMLGGLNDCIDVIVPRGGRELVARVKQDARVPIFAHLEGLCHVYVDRSADLQMAIDLVVNAKMRRTGICGSAETLLIDSAAAKSHLPPILDALKQSGCTLRLDEKAAKIYPDTEAATPADWATEYLDSIITVGIVDGVDDAIEHINRYSSGHTEAIISEDAQTVTQFFNRIDSAILLHNASTQFADGGEFGMGAEIGIATGKMHARGPVGVEQLTSFKYLVRGSGQARP